MRRSRTLLSLLVCVAAATIGTGCGGAYDNPIKSKPPQAELEAQGTEPGSEPPRAGSDDKGGEREAEPPRGQGTRSESKPPRVTSPTRDTKPEAATASKEDLTNTIHLSAGVALPQSLPTGTALGVSVDYTFVGGRPKPSDSYFWVIEPAKGEPLMQPAQLMIQGTLSGFIPQLRPEQGPFRTYIVDPSGNRLSKTVPLRR